MSFKHHEPLASLREVADHLGVAGITARRFIRRGRLPAMKIGGQIRIKWSDVEALKGGGTMPSGA